MPQSESAVADTSLPPSPGPEYRLWMIFCGTEYRTTRWLGPQDFADGAVRDQVDQRLRQLVAVPSAMGVRPDGRGVTGIPSMFWVDGYRGAPLQATWNELGLTVTVTAQLAGVEWDFGDGTPPLQAGLGEPYPEHSSVQHAYRDPSGARPFRVTARLILQPTYTVDGATGAPLAPIVVPVTRDYVVREVQAVRRS
jgi:hypothetical protein